MIAFALDSQEVTFIKLDLAQSDQLYVLIISIAGVGALISAAASAAFAKRFSLQSNGGYFASIPVTVIMSLLLCVQVFRKQQKHYYEEAN